MVEDDARGPILIADGSEWLDFLTCRVSAVVEDSNALHFVHDYPLLPLPMFSPTDRRSFSELGKLEICRVTTSASPTRI